ncbi:MAG TPA: branched-chain amino acid ABC transporter substrate-binding protein [Solirubrobacteraceae bacterium]
MHARWPGLVALAAAALAASGCGGAGATSNEATGNLLAIYSSLPLQGPSAAISQQIVGGEKLALSQVGGQIGKFKIGYVSLDDSDPASGKSTPGVTATNAKTAAQDTSTIAYLGDLGSTSTALSLPLINAAGILQVSPSSPYVGLTSSLDAGQDEPERFYLSGHRTFGRLQPGDTVQAAAQARLLVTLGVRRVYVLDDQDPFEEPLAKIAAADATRAGIAVAAHDSLATVAGSVYSGEVEKIVRSGAQAVLFAGGPGPGTVALWQALHTAAPHLLLIGSSSLTGQAFTSQLGTAAASTYLTTPILDPSQYPPASARVLADYRRTFGGEAGPYVLYGYETMSVVLDAIRAAGSHGNDRQTVIARFFATHDRKSVLGPYSVMPDGDTTMTRYGADRVIGGRAVFYRSFDLGARALAPEAPLASGEGG